MITLVLLPGMDGTGTLFADFAAAAKSEFKPVVVAYPNDPKLGYAELEPIARAALSVNEPYVILGESFSGPIAISIAASNPRGLVGLILCATFARNPHPLLPLATALMRPFPAGRVPPFILDRQLFGRFVSPRLRKQVRALRSLVSKKTLKARTEAVAQIAVSRQLREVRAPILCLRAKEDRVVPRGACDYMMRIRPDAELAELDAPHLLLQAVPGDALAAIKSFVDRRAGNSAR